MSFPRPSIEFCVTTLGGNGHDSHNSVSKLIQNGEYEEFAAKFINGLVHQGYHQTGHERSVGGSTANRIVSDLLSLITVLGGDTSNFDYEKFRSLLNLDKYKEN